MSPTLSHHSDFTDLLRYLERVPAVSVLGSGEQDGTWWCKFAIEIADPLAWNVVQEFGHVLNTLSVNEPLPTLFKPVSPPPYLNGGPEDFLSWVIECPQAAMAPATVAQWLEGRLPRPVEDSAAWDTDASD